MAGYGRKTGYTSLLRGAGAFNPKSLSGLALWLDASDTSTITLTGGVVSEWRDKSGNARHAVQTTALERPSLQTNVINGRNAVRFDGTNDSLIFSSGLDLFRNVSAATLIAVAKTTTPAATMRIFHASTAAIASNRIALVSVSGAMTFRVRRLDGDSEAVLTGSAVATNTPQIFRGEVDYANRPGELFMDGASAASNATLVTAGSTSDTASNNVTIGAQGGGAARWAGDILEVIALQRLLTEDEAAALEAHLAAKWGVTLA